MNAVRLAAAALCLASAAPALAQEWPIDPGDFVEVAMIDVDDGHSLEYANHLAGIWRKGQDYARQQGWITNYQIWTNENPRAGEADVWLVTWTPRLPDAAEVKRRDKAYNAFMQTTVAQMEAASGQRATYRKVAGSMLLRNQVWAK